jgi:three-Cys-motif partner protein
MSLKSLLCRHFWYNRDEYGQADGNCTEGSMRRQKGLRFDGIGYWSEVKLDIIREYASAYSSILSAQEQPPLYHVYIDAFAGASVHISKTGGHAIPGSPVNAVNTEPPFREYHLIDLDGNKVEHLRGLLGDRPGLHLYHGDCNDVLLQEVFPKVRFKDYRRGLCVLDPYGLHLNWAVLQRAGEMRSIELFLNFPIMDMNRNVFWRHPEKVGADDIARMNAFWGDDSWRHVAYITQMSLFEPFEEKAGNKAIANAFRKRLKEVAGFKSVPEPVPMRNSKGATVYYLFFASHKPVAEAS